MMYGDAASGTDSLSADGDMWDEDPSKYSWIVPTFQMEGGSPYATQHPFAVEGDGFGVHGAQASTHQPGELAPGLLPTHDALLAPQGGVTVKQETQSRRRTRAEYEDSQSSSNAPASKQGGAKQQSPEQQSPANGGKSTSKDNKKASNAKNCKRHREKRKREEQAIRNRNLELVKERELFLERIAQLQTEVASLRAGGQVDIRKENALLRAEIQKHKSYVQNIVSACSEASLGMVTPEEQYRVLRNFLDSGCAQAIGLAYTSFSERSWRRARSIDVGHGLSLHPWFEYLPRNTKPEDAKRVNVRVDLLDFPCPLQVMRPKIWSIFSSPEILNSVLNKENGLSPRREANHISMPEGVARIREEQNQEDINILHFKSFRKPKSDEVYKEFFLITSLKDSEIFPCAYEQYEKEGLITPRGKAGSQGKGAEGNDDTSPDKVVVYVASSCDATLEKAHMEKVLPQRQERYRIDTLLISCVARQREESPDKCDITMLASYPMNMVPGNYWGEAALPFSQDGVPSDAFVNDLKLQFKLILEASGGSL